MQAHGPGVIATAAYLSLVQMVFTAPAPESAPSVQASASPTPARSTPQLPLFSRSGYFIMGSSPMVSMYANGFAPGIRYDVESGFAFRRGNLRLMFGANPKLMQYFGRKRPAGGLDGVVTASWRAVYVRAGAGVMANLPSGPRGAELARVLPAVGGVAGIGVQTMRDHVGGRMGVDYDFRVDTTGTRIQTVMFTLQLWFG